VYDVFARYLKIIPSSGPFYRTPLTASFGFGKHYVGVNTLGKYMQSMFTAVDIDATNQKLLIIQVVLVAAYVCTILASMSRLLCRARVIVVMLFMVISVLL